MTEKKWVKNKYSSDDFNDLISKNGFSRPIATVLAGRDINNDNLDSYFNASLKTLTSPYRIPGMKEACERLWSAIKKGEHILIHGDFDVDGITASAVMSWILSQNGANVNVFIPLRLDTGYGFTPDSLDRALALYKCDVLVTVDCGITSNDAIEKANSLGIDTIITDHHMVGAELPDALTIVNTKLHPHLSDLHCLAGVGVAFKLAHALVKYGLENNLIYNRIDLREILDLVALGTVADIVPLVGENRVLTKFGLKVLAKQIRPGIRALCDVSGITNIIKSSDIAFKLAPYINAAGRLGDPNIAYRLLVTDNIVDALSLAQQLKDYNLQRRLKEREIFNEAESQIYEKIKINEAYSILIYGEGWHQGVIGNVASRIARDYNRPSIALTIIDGRAYGSGRSSANVDLVGALSKSADILTRYGGHPMAVGLSLLPSNIESLCHRFEESIREVLTKEDLTPKIEYDGDIFISEINDDFFEDMAKLEPFGHSNIQPAFKLSNLFVPYKTLAGQCHTRGYVRDNNNNSIAFIAFNLMPESLPPQPWNILAVPQLNQYNNRISHQLRIVDIKSSHDDY
jgi:single-stranded-DNA-specific exonuclease